MWLAAGVQAAVHGLDVALECLLRLGALELEGGGEEAVLNRERLRCEMHCLNLHQPPLWDVYCAMRKRLMNYFATCSISRQLDRAWRFAICRSMPF